MKRFILLIVGALALSPTSAFAYDWFTIANVTAIEGTYMPTSLNFKVNQNSGSCSAGSALYWTPPNPDPTTAAQNAQAILAMLMTAEVSGRTVTILGDNNGCAVRYVYLN